MAMAGPRFSVTSAAAVRTINRHLKVEDEIGRGASASAAVLSFCPELSGLAMLVSSCFSLQFGPRRDIMELREQMTCKVAARYVGDVAIIDVSGRLTLGEGAGMLRNLIKDLLKADERELLVNLKDVTYIDSAALGELVSAYASITNAGGAVKLLNAQGRVAEVLAVTKLYTVFESFADEAAAVQSFSSATPDV
jgi:anti-sigma B factor antagonist